MADYIYLLEHRLSAAQRAAIVSLRQLATESGLTLFLVGGAVRDLTSGSPLRDLDFVVQGSASVLRPAIESAGIEIVGQRESMQTMYLRMPGGVRAELGSTLSASWPKPATPVFQASNLAEDLRRRDFTANAMALSLNDGSYGLLIDPLNGVADIENRQLRLVSNYGFIEEPVRMIRAARLMARLGWTLEEKTQVRYETGRREDFIKNLSDFHRGYELEEIVHEEDPMRVIKRLETDGWMKVLAPFWTAAKINAAEMEKLREVQMQLQAHGIDADGGAAGFPLLTAKLSTKESATLKASFPRKGFIDEIEALESESKEFAAQLSGKSASAPSAAWNIILAAKPEAVLHTAFSSRSAAVQAKLKAFLTEWPQARQRIPFMVMQEMRITPEMDGYQNLVERLFFELIDGRLGTTEDIKAFLEPYSPPAPPPPVNLRRTRVAKKDAKPLRGRGKKDSVELEDPEETTAGEQDEDGDEISVASSATEDDDLPFPLILLDEDEEEEEEADSEDEEGDEVSREDSALSVEKGRSKAPKSQAKDKSSRTEAAGGGTDLQSPLSTPSSDKVKKLPRKSRPSKSSDRAEDVSAEVSHTEKASGTGKARLDSTVGKIGESDVAGTKSSKAGKNANTESAHRKSAQPKIASRTQTKKRSS